MKRVGCTTVSFRQHFAATRAPKSPPPAGPDYSLLDMPAMMADRLGVHNVEVWNSHFAERTVAYGERLRAAAEKVRSRIINIQLDGPEYDLSHADPEARKRSIDYVKGWMDLAHASGATSLRPNTGGRGNPPPPFDLAITGGSFRQLAEHGEKIGVKVLIENHGGYSSNLEHMLAIVKYAGRNCATVPDFGNFAGVSEEERFRQLGVIFTQSHLVSAKGMYFDDQKRHITYDFAACMRVGEKSGFKGIYSAEFWTPTIQPIDPWEAARLIVDMIVTNI
jgi:sugar phosphate isomerase/epimerase